MESEAINDSPWSRFYILLCYGVFGLHIVRRFRTSPRAIVVVSSKLCIKSSSFTTLAEAHAMAFVARHTSIPVPKVYCAFTHKGRVYIAMEHIEGQMLAVGWTERSAESKERILNQLKTMIEELRSIPPPPYRLGVSNVNGGPIFDERLPTKSLWGPFSTIHDFHLELRNNIDNIRNAADFPGLSELISFHNQPWPQPVFTHGDLSSFNILVRGDDVVGIIDWETAGWLPPYWEYTTASDVNFRNLFWEKEVGRFLTPLPHEAEMERVRRQYFGGHG